MPQNPQSITISTVNRYQDGGDGSSTNTAYSSYEDMLADMNDDREDDEKFKTVEEMKKWMDENPYENGSHGRGPSIELEVLPTTPPTYRLAHPLSLYSHNQ